jgi:signal transduction histidine kinase
VFSRRCPNPPASRGRLETLLERLTAPVLLFNDGGLSFANQAAREMFRISGGGDRPPAAVLGHGGLAGAVGEALATSQPVEVEVTTDGLVLQARAVPLGAGEAALLVTDLTEARRLEAMRRDFVTNASHELKTPAAAMQALAESLALAVDQDPARTRQMIDRLRDESQRLSSLVRELLDLSRLEEGPPSRYGAVNLAAIVRQQTTRMARTAEDLGVSVHAECPEPATVVGIPGDLRLVVMNLLSNAIGYNRRGGEVRISVAKTGAAVVLEVADTGIGIAEPDLARIFERFYRVDKARSRAAGGTGLGLSIVRHAVQRHGGQITVTSAPGEGSTFRVTLPVEGARAVSG